MRQIERLEIDAAKSCNLSCTACNHLSPLFKKGFADPLLLAQDLGRLASHLHAKTVRVLGGEPLLHPKIVAVLEAIRESGIGDRLTVVTNGIMLEQMAAAFWDQVDLVDVSLYPGVVLHAPTLAAHPEKVRIRSCDSFYETFSLLKNEDPSLVRKIVDRCKVLDYCFGVVDGMFYRCMRAAYISEKVPHPELTPTCDGLRIDGPDLGTRLEEYLSPGRVLASCSFCTGTDGQRFGHSETRRDSWLERHNRPVSAMLK